VHVAVELGEVEDLVAELVVEIVLLVEVGVSDTQRT
jgi:hypothetical protein